MLSLVFSAATSSAAQAAADWNLGNTEASQILDLNAPADGAVRNDGLSKCLDDLSGSTTNHSTVDSSACTGLANQDWTFTPSEDYDWDLGVHGTLTLTGAPGKCLDVTSANGGAAKAVAEGGTVQMLLTTSGEVYAKDTRNVTGPAGGSGISPQIALDGSWTKESDTGVQKIAAGSDGTQMMIGFDNTVYARNTIAATPWTSEGGSSVQAIATNGGVQLYLDGDGTVYARSGIGSSTGWTTESGTGAKAISVGSDGTQMMIGSDGAVYARSGIGSSTGWTKEQAPGALAIATNGGVQMLLGSNGDVYARTGIALNGWTRESDPIVDPVSYHGRTVLAAGSDGTQMVIDASGYADAKKGIALNGWTRESGLVDTDIFHPSIAAGANGVQAVILSTGVVAARVGIGTTNWLTESDLTAETDNGRPVQLFDCHGWRSQQWRFRHDKTGGVQLYNPVSGRCVDTPNASTADGVALQIYTCNDTFAQHFSPPATPEPPSGPITNATMNKCAIPASTLAAPADGTAVVLYTCGVGYTTGPLLPWKLNLDGTLTAGGLCLAVAGGEAGTANGALVQLTKCGGSLDQQWAVGYDTSNRPLLLNPNTGRCLDDPNQSTANGTQLRLYTCSNTTAQVWDIPHASHTFVGPVAATSSTLPAGTGDINAREAAMDEAATARDTRAHLAMLLHAGGIGVRTSIAQTLAGPDSALNEPWSDYVSENWENAPNTPADQDVAKAAIADQARGQRTDGISRFLSAYPMGAYGSQPDFDADVTNFMSRDSTFWLAGQAMTANLPITHADQAAQDKVTAIAATHAAADPSKAWYWNFYRDQANQGSADDVRRFIQYDGYPTVAPVAGTQEFRVEVESLKARWASGDPSNPFDPDHVLIEVEETAWAEWQTELNAQAQPRADILADEMQALEALQASAETMHDGLDYAWTAGGILWAQGQKTANQSGWSSVDMSHATHDLGLIRAKVVALASAAQNEALIAQDAAAKAEAARDTAYATATASGLPEGRGLSYALQSAQVTRAAAAAAQATANAMKTAVAATNSTLADSATLLANASAQAHAARALYLRQTAQDNAAQASALATQAANQAAAAATAATAAAADKAAAATTETQAKAALAKADAAAADAANQATIAANAKATAETQRANAAAADASAQTQAATAATKEAAAAAAAGTAQGLNATAQQAAATAAAARANAEEAQRAKHAADAKAQALAAVAAANQGTDAAAGATAAAQQAQADADAAGVAADEANASATQASNAAAAAQAAATRARSAAETANSDAVTADAAAEQTNAAARKGDSLAADAIAQAGIAAAQSDAAQASAAQAKTDADKAKVAADGAQTEAALTASDAATATGQALATAQAAQSAAAEAATVAAPANEAIDLAAPYAARDSAAGLASLTSEAAKTMAQQQSDVAAAQAAQAAVLAAAAQAAAAAASGDAKLAAQAAADAATSASQAAHSAAAAMASAAQAAADAATTKATAGRIHTIDAQTQADADDAHASAAAAGISAAAAQAAATASELDAASAGAAASGAAESAADAQNHADDAASSAASANAAAATAQSDADAAQTAAATAEADQAAQEAANRIAAQQAAAAQAASGQPALDPSDQALLLASCGQTCVDNYNQAQALVGTDLQTFIIDNGGQLILDFIGVDDVEACFDKGDVEGCVWTLVDLVPVTKLLKAGDLVAKLVELSPKIAKFIKDVKKAKQTLKEMQELLKELQKAKALEDLSHNLDQVCGGRVKPGEIDYGPLGPGGRATIGVACLTKPLAKGSGTDSTRYDVAGYQDGRDRAEALDPIPVSFTINACHLIGDQLGGKGDRTDNLVTCTRAANAFPIAGVRVLTPNMLTYESQIKAAVAGPQEQTVAYVVVPEYDGSNVIPYAIKMTAKCVANCTNNPINISATIQNEMWSPNRNAWVNISQ
ncbi:ricin-type beta-trefoil lectin domain protein [Streptomyces cocklensis]|uniref:ricin-type beta-trefoil lectin domain protein n=1 Tax=Actinacidiphila cocklensis TaxID=887465 RepID=UPI00203F84F8|nr:ricin-type beta-trefoil lectin domain protein [Actinacidiphila cocklensis]MDD1061417.1 ricin-type beta-trefoil lectin domain protein [Actinacidiphila cocklensis]WSX76744.1 ricin-type beta-trefoil lectin domain protein [Streptomyces sp. NBC_00899]